MVSRLLIVGFIVFPLLSLVALLGPLRKRENPAAIRTWIGLAAVAAAVAFLAAAARPPLRVELVGSFAALLLLPSSGIFVAMRTAAVRASPKFGFILVPLGFAAGCGVAAQILVSLGGG